EPDGLWPASSWLCYFCAQPASELRRCADHETRQAWPGSAAEQVVTCSCVPSALASAGSARHRPEFGFVSIAPAPPGMRCHNCPGLPSQECRSTDVPMLTPDPLTSRHLPCTVTVPSACTSQACAAEPSQVRMSTAVPSAVWLPLSSRHLPGMRDAAGPAGSVHAWFRLPVQDQITTRVPFVLPQPGSARHMPDPRLRSMVGRPPSDGFTALG